MPTTAPTISPHRSIGRAAGEALVGTILVVTGVTFLVIAVSRGLVLSLTVGGRPLADQPTLGLLAWIAVVAAPTVLVLLGTDHLARILAWARSGAWRRADPFADLPDGVTIVRGMVLDDARPVGTVLVGRFGMAVVHVLDRTAVRTDTLDRWDDPRDAVTRDAERLRAWIDQQEHDFVVRVHAVALVPEPGLARTPACAVVPIDGLAGWVDAQPAQRSLTDARRDHLVRLATDRT